MAEHTLTYIFLFLTIILLVGQYANTGQIVVVGMIAIIIIQKEKPPKVICPHCLQPQNQINSNGLQNLHDHKIMLIKSIINTIIDSIV